MNTNINKCRFIIKYKCVGHNYVEKISQNICLSMSAHSTCTGNFSKIKTSSKNIVEKNTSALRNRRYGVQRRAHLSKDFIQPLKRPMKMNLNPTRSTGNILPVIFRSPALNKTHSNGAHFGELVHCLKPMVDRLGQKLSKLLIVKNFEAAAAGNLTDSCGMKAVMKVAVPTLNKYAAVTETLRIHLPTNIVQMNTFSNMPPSVFNC